MPPAPPPPPPPPSFKQKKNPLPNTNNPPKTVPNLPTQNLPPVEQAPSIQNTPMLAPMTKSEPSPQNTPIVQQPQQTTIPKLNTEVVQNENSELKNLRGLDKWDIDADDQRILEEGIKKPEAPKVEEKKDNPNENYNKAIQLGIQSLSFCSVPLEDEEDLPNKNVDPFLLRTLPFVIGTKEFFEDEYCGLKEVLQEKEQTVEEVVPTQNGDKHPQETNHETQENKEIKQNMFTITEKLPGDDLQMESMFGQDESTQIISKVEEPKEEKKLFNEVPKDNSTKNLFSEIKRQTDPTDEFDLDSVMNDFGKDIVTAPKKNSDFVFDFGGDEEKKPEKKGEQKNVASVLFTEEPQEKKKEKGMFDTEDIEEEEIVKKKKEKVSISFDNNLFGEETFEPKKKGNSSFTANTETKKKNEFDILKVDDLLDDVLSSEIKEEPKKKEVKKETKKEVKKDLGMFDDLLDEPFEPKKEVKKEVKKETKKSGGLFDTDFDEPLEIKKEETKKEIKKETNLFVEPKKEEITEKKEEKKDFQSNIISGLQKLNQGPIPKKPEVKKDLFGDLEEDEKKETKIETKIEPRKETNLFPEESKEEVNEKKNFQSNIIAGLQKMNTGTPITIKKQNNSGLFESGSLDDPLGIKIKGKKEEPVKTSNLFIVGDDPLDSPKEKKEIPKELFVPQKNLFNFEEEPKKESVLFDSKKETKKSGGLFDFDDPLDVKKDTKKETKKSGGLFDFDDPLDVKKDTKKEEPKKETKNDLFGETKKETKKIDSFDTLKNDDLDFLDTKKDIKKDEKKSLDSNKESKVEPKKEINLFSEEPKEEVNEKKNFKSNIIAGLQKMNSGTPVQIKKPQNNNPLFDSEESVLSKSIEKKKLTIVEEPKIQFERVEVTNNSRDGNSDKPVLEHTNLGRSKGAKKRAPQKNLKVSLDSLETVGETDLKKVEIKKEEPKKIETKKEEPKKIETKKEEPKIIKETPKKEEPKIVKESPIPTKESPIPTKESPIPTKETKKEEDEFEIFQHKRTPKVVKEKSNKSQNLFSSNMDELFDEKKETKKETKKDTKSSVFDLNENDFLTKKTKKETKVLPEETKKEEPKKEEKKQEEPKKEVKKEESSLFNSQMTDPFAKKQKDLFELPEEKETKKKEKKTDDFFGDFDISVKKKEKTETAPLDDPLFSSKKKEKKTDDFFGDILNDPLTSKKETKKKTNNFFE